MPKPTIGQPDWGGVLNDHLDSLDATKASIASVDALTTEVATKQASASLDADIATKIDAPASATRASLSARYAAVLTAGGGDQLAAIQAHLDAPGPLGAKRLVGSFSVAGTITVPAGLYLDLSAATVTQTAGNVATFSMQAGATIHAGKLIGKTTDFVAGTGSFTPTANGVRLDGADCTIERTVFTGFAHAAIFANNNAARARISNIKVTGVHGLSGVTIPAGDARCYGFLAFASVTDAVVEDSDITNVSIGVITNYDTTGFTAKGLRITNVLGQHGLYLQNATDLKVSDIYGNSIALSLVKVQLAAVSSTDHAYNCRISQVSGRNIGDNVVLLINTDTAMAAARKFYGVNISGVNGVNATRVVYLGNIRGGQVAGISGDNTTHQVLTIIDCQDVEVDGIASRVSGREVVLFSNAAAVSSTGSSTQRVAVRNLRAYNPCNENNASFIAAISISAQAAGTVDNASILLDGIDVDADNSTGASTYMRFGLFLNAAAPQETLRVRNFRPKGWSNNPASLASALRDLAEWSNCENPATVANFPVARLVRIGGIGNKARWVCNAIPTNGVVQQGDVIHNSAPAAAGAPGWVATSVGGLYGGSWAASTAYTTADWRRATTTGRVMECTVAGTSGATEPAWNSAAVGDVFADGTVTWVVRATSLGVVKAMANIAA